MGAAHIKDTPHPRADKMVCVVLLGGEVQHVAADQRRALRWFAGLTGVHVVRWEPPRLAVRRGELLFQGGPGEGQEELDAEWGWAISLGGLRYSFWEVAGEPPLRFEADGAEVEVPHRYAYGLAVLPAEWPVEPPGSPGALSVEYRAWQFGGYFPPRMLSGEYWGQSDAMRQRGLRLFFGGTPDGLWEEARRAVLGATIHRGEHPFALDLEEEDAARPTWREVGAAFAREILGEAPELEAPPRGVALVYSAEGEGCGTACVAAGGLGFPCAALEFRGGAECAEAWLPLEWEVQRVLSQGGQLVLRLPRGRGRKYHLPLEYYDLAPKIFYSEELPADIPAEYAGEAPAQSALGERLSVVTRLQSTPAHGVR